MLFSTNDISICFPHINFVKIFNVHECNEHFHVNAYGTMQRTYGMSRIISRCDTFCAKSKRTTVGKIKMIFFSRDLAIRSTCMCNFPKFCYISRSCTRVHTIYVYYTYNNKIYSCNIHIYSKQFSAPSRCDDATLFLSPCSRAEPSHGKLKSVESRIKSSRDQAGFRFFFHCHLSQLN